MHLRRLVIGDDDVVTNTAADAAPTQMPRSTASEFQTASYRNLTQQQPERPKKQKHFPLTVPTPELRILLCRSLSVRPQ